MSKSARITTKHTDEELAIFDALSFQERHKIQQNLGRDMFILMYGSERLMTDTSDSQEEHNDKIASKLKYPDGNPKTQFGIAKPGDWYTPPIPYYEYSMAHLQGALKYGHFNWRDDPVTMSTYIEAAKRHVDLFKAGQENASDTGIHHLAHAMCCFSIIIDAMAHGTMRDDRFYYRGVTIDHEPLNELVKANPGMVLEKYIEDAQPRVKAIREKWTGFAEAQLAKKEQRG